MKLLKIKTFGKYGMKITIAELLIPDYINLTKAKIEFENINTSSVLVLNNKSDYIKTRYDTIEYNTAVKFVNFLITKGCTHINTEIITIGD